MNDLMAQAQWKELGGIREELMAIRSSAERVAVNLESIADSLSIPSAPIEPAQAKQPTEEVQQTWISLPALRKALQLVRDALDSKEAMGEEDIVLLHEAEELLSVELGHPVWEGRKVLEGRK